MDINRALREGDRHLDAGRFADALAAYDVVAAACVGGAGDREDLAVLTGRRAMALHEMGRWPEALVAYDRTIATYKALARRSPAYFGRRLAGALGNSARLLAEMDRYEEAGERITEALRAEGLGDERGLVPFLLNVGIRVFTETDPGRARELHSQVLALDEGQHLTKSVWLWDLATPQNLLSVFGLAQEKERDLRHLLRAPRQEPVVPTLGGTSASGLLFVLRGWASYSTIPLLRWDDTAPGANGGGFLLWWDEWGGVVDPGIGFARAMYRAGLVLRNIDAVVCTHDHIDHTGDLPALRTCIYEAHDEDCPAHPIGFYLGPGPYHTNHASLTQLNARGVDRVVQMEPGVGMPLERRGRQVGTLCPVPADHRDLSPLEHPAVGLLFSLTDETQSGVCKVAFTGDTRLPDPVPAALAGADLLVINLGSVYPPDVGRPLTDSQRHLGVNGTVAYISKLRELSAPDWEPLILVSEWGEELRGYRRYVCQEIVRRTGMPASRVIPSEEQTAIALWPGRAEPVCTEHHDRVAVTWVENPDGVVRYLCEDCTKS